MNTKGIGPKIIFLRIVLEGHELSHLLGMFDIIYLDVAGMQ